MLYSEASYILELVETKHGSVKNLVFSSTYKNKRQLMALVCETVKVSSILQEILNATKFHEKEKLFKNMCLAKVVLYDYLFGKGLDACPANLKEAVDRHGNELRLKLQQVDTSAEAVVGTSQMNSSLIPRYVRVNTLKISTSQVIDCLCRENYSLVSTEACDFEQYLSKLQTLKLGEFAIDLNVPDLLVFPAGTEFHQHNLYVDGSLILQDKASCVPAVVLNPPPGSVVIDCCSAPGNKTSQLAALMNNKGKIYAFDKDPNRVSTMNTLLSKAGAHCVKTACRDFLRVRTDDPKYADVQYVLVDPSCSGSGIVGRVATSDAGSTAKVDSKRLESLGSFQAMILRHAMSFPSVRKVVYSTCSVHERENELVVSDVLSRCPGTFELIDVVSVLGYPEHSRGSCTSLPGAEKCLRLTPDSTLTNGFFVACLERIETDEKSTCSDAVSVPTADRRFKKRQTSDSLQVNHSDRDGSRERTEAVRPMKRLTKSRSHDKPSKCSPAIQPAAAKKYKKQKRSKKRTARNPVTA